MRIRTIRRTFIPQHIEQFSCTRGGNFQYLPDIKFMRTSTEPSCVSPRIPVRKKSLYELPFLLPLSPLPTCNPLTSFSLFFGRISAEKKSLLWTANRILFFMWSARVRISRANIRWLF